NMRAAESVRELAARKAVTAGQIALAWLLHKGDDVVPIPGTKRRKYLEENVRAADGSLTSEEMGALDAALATGKGAGPRYGPAQAAWDPARHRTVAEIAWEYLTLRARARAVALLMHGPAQADFASLRPAKGTAAERDRVLFVNAATWADLVRNRREPWHVYSHPTWHYA